jgi:hypothetical protein
VERRRGAMVQISELKILGVTGKSVTANIRMQLFYSLEPSTITSN